MIVIGWWGIGVVRFENKYCRTADGLDGTCYTRRQCREIDGTYSGLCAGTIGRCCTSKFSSNIPFIGTK